MKRVQWIDNAKAIGIFLVVLGHLSNPKHFSELIYSFHMPLFFFLSGCTFSKNEVFKKFLAKKSKSILMPYLVFGLLTYFFWLFIGRNYGVDRYSSVEWWRPLVGMVYSVGINGWLSHNTPLWFLTCLFVSELLLFYFVKLKYVVLLIFSIVISFLGYICSLCDVPAFPWSLNTVPQALFFLTLGFLVRESNLVQRYFQKQYFYLFLPTTAILFLSSYANGRVDMMSNSYGHFLLFLISAISGVGLTILLANLISIRFLRVIGQNSLVVFLCHGIATSIWKGFAVFVLGFNLSFFDKSLFVNFFMTLLVIGTLVPMSILIYRYAPWLIGAKRKFVT